MTSTVNPTIAYLQAIQADLRRILATLNTRLEQLENALAEIYDAQTWLLENGAPMFILANQNTAVTYLSNHHLALIELIRHITHLLTVIQALLHSGTEP
jgi:uncharacterized circularly permuted ATP-grasp superfamily protein